MATPSFQYIQPADLTAIYSYTPPKDFTPENVSQAIAYSCERINSLTGNQIENYGFDKLTPNQQALVKRATCRLTIGCLEGVALAWASGSISVSGGSLSFSQSTEAQFVDKVVIRDVFDLLQNAGLYQPRKYVENAYSPRDCRVDTYWDPLEPIEKYFRYIDWGTADARYVQLQRISSPDGSISITYNVLQQTLQLTAKGGGGAGISGVLPTPNEIDVDNTIASTPQIKLANAIKTAIATNASHIGDLTKLTTTAKTDCVSAINEAVQNAETAGNLATAFGNVDSIFVAGSNIGIARDNTNQKMTISADVPTFNLDEFVQNGNTVSLTGKVAKHLTLSGDNDLEQYIENAGKTTAVNFLGSDTIQFLQNKNEMVSIKPGIMAVNNARITGIGAPTDTQDAVNKEYADLISDTIFNSFANAETAINVPAPISRDASSTIKIHKFSWSSIPSFNPGPTDGYSINLYSVSTDSWVKIVFRNNDSVGSQLINTRDVVATMDNTGKFFVITSSQNYSITDWQLKELYKSGIVALQNDYNQVNTRLTTAEGNITTLQGQYGTLNTRLTTAEGNITSLTTRMTAAEQGIVENAENINTIYNNLSQQLTVPDNFNLTLDDPKTLSSPDMSTIAGWVEDFGTNYTIEIFNTTNSATQYVDVEIGKILVNQHWYNDIVNVVYDASTHTFKLQSQNPLTVTAGTIKGIELIGASGSTSPWKQLEDQTAWTYDSTNKVWNRTNWTTLPNNAQYRIEANNGNALYSILTSDKYLVNGGNGISKWDWQGDPLIGTGCWFEASVGASQSGIISFVDKTGTNLDSTSARFTVYVKLGYL